MAAHMTITWKSRVRSLSGPSAPCHISIYLATYQAICLHVYLSLLNNFSTYMSTYLSIMDLGSCSWNFPWFFLDESHLWQSAQSFGMRLGSCHSWRCTSRPPGPSKSPGSWPHSGLPGPSWTPCTQWCLCACTGKCCWPGCCLGSCTWWWSPRHDMQFEQTLHGKGHTLQTSWRTYMSRPSSGKRWQ